MKRHFYGLYNPYGRISRESFNGHPGYAVVVFDTAKERDDWADDGWDGQNWTCFSVTRKEAIFDAGMYAFDHPYRYDEELGYVK